MSANFSSLFVVLIWVIRTKLGPRIIPYFRHIVSQSVSMIREENSGIYPVQIEFHSLSEAIDEDAHSVLRGLLLSIPTFWGSGEVKQVITLFIDQYSSPNTSAGPLASLIKTVPKKVPSKVLVPAMIDMWSFVQTTFQPVCLFWGLYTFGDYDRASQSRVKAYFEILSKVLRSAARPTVLEHLRPLFNVFLEAFEVAALSTTNVDVSINANS